MVFLQGFFDLFFRGLSRGSLLSGLRLRALPLAIFISDFCADDTLVGSPYR